MLLHRLRKNVDVFIIIVEDGDPEEQLVEQVEEALRGIESYPMKVSHLVSPALRNAIVSHWVPKHR